MLMSLQMDMLVIPAPEIIFHSHWMLDVNDLTPVATLTQICN